MRGSPPRSIALPIPLSLSLCPAYQDIRAAHPALFANSTATETLQDQEINQWMNPPASLWRQLGAYISSCMKERERLISLAPA